MEKTSNNMKIKNSPYIRFIKLLECIDTFSVIDPTELFILRKLFILWSHEEKVLVGDFMQFNQIASSATLHRKLNHLIKLKLLQTQKYDSLDSRKKIILPTPKLEKDFARLNLIFKKALI